jgi:hypothetical protein
MALPSARVGGSSAGLCRVGRRSHARISGALGHVVPLVRSLVGSVLLLRVEYGTAENYSYRPFIRRDF